MKPPRQEQEPTRGRDAWRSRPDGTSIKPQCSRAMKTEETRGCPEASKHDDLTLPLGKEIHKIPEHDTKGNAGG